MLTKKILLGGIALGVLAAAGSAGATNLSGTAVGGVTVVAGTTVTPYIVATEAKANLVDAAAVAGTALVTTAGTGQTIIATNLVSGSVASGGQYSVTYNITGASFTTTGTGAVGSTSLVCGATAGTLAGTTASTCSAVLQSSTASQVVFLVTTNAATASFQFGAPFTLAAPGAVTVSSQVALASSGATIDNGLSSATIINAAQAFSATIGTTGATSEQASLVSAFKNFVAVTGTLPVGSASTTVAQIGSITVGLNTANTFYYDLLGDAAAAGQELGATYAVNGTVGSTETFSINGVNSTAGTTTVAASTAAFANGLVTVNQTGAAVLAASAYSVTVTPKLNTTFYTAGVPALLTLGSVTYQGTNITAPWLGDGSNNYVSVVRIANDTSVAIPGPTAMLLSPAVNSSGSAGSALTATCSSAALGASTIPANSSITISSATLQACFGNFGNSDVLFTIQSNASISAKLRIINASTGVVTEQSLGTGQGTTFGTYGQAASGSFTVQ